MTIGATSAIAAAVLKTFKLIIVGSICGIRPNHFRRLAFPSPRTDRAQYSGCQIGTVRGMNRSHRFRGNSPPKAAANTVGPGRAGYCQVLPQLAIRVWTIRRADGITTPRLLELAEPS
jgi:hypothetical protein